MCKYSVVIPVYNSGAWLSELAERIGNTLSQTNETFEVVLVNDASPDGGNTWRVIEELAEKYPWLRGFSLLYNTGQFRATLCGLEFARGEYILTMDDDFQHAPEELSKLIQGMAEHPDMDCIFGLYETRHDSLIRRMGSRLFSSILNRLYGKPKGIKTSSFRIMSRPFAKALTLYKSATPQLGPIISSLGRNIMNVPVKHEPRKYGKSNYSLFRLMRETFLSVINASVAPLRFLSVIGFLAAAGSFCLTLYYLFRYLFVGIGIAGFTTQILIITFFSGLIMLSLGLTGEYIGRVIAELTGMPRYVVLKQTEPEEQDSGGKTP